jgi:hypothetical protein
VGAPRRVHVLARLSRRIYARNEGEKTYRKREICGDHGLKTTENYFSLLFLSLFSSLITPMNPNPTTKSLSI